MKKRIIVVSDWHLGGKSDKEDSKGKSVSRGKICRSEKWMNEFISWLEKESQSYDGKIELVINGDFIDFLTPNDAYEPAEWISNEDEICRRLSFINRQIKEKLGESPLDILKNFLLKPNCKLTLLLGNHDVELSLPKVRRELSSIIGANQGNFKLIYDGEACVFGELLIEHGNRYDKWNVIDHSRLRQERSHRSRGLIVEEGLREKHFFQPSAGTLLVIHALNVFLAECPFLNFVKPETGAGIPLMIAINPKFGEFFDRLFQLRPLVSRLWGGRLADSAKPASSGNLAASMEMPRNILSLKEFLNTMLDKDDAKHFLLNDETGNVGVRENFASLCGKIKTSTGELRELVDKLFALVKIGASKDSEESLKKLRIALKCLAQDRSFDPCYEESEYLHSAKTIAKEGGFKVIVFGHTHLPKNIRFSSPEKGDACYLNTGSWASVLKIPEKIHSSVQEGKEELGAFLEEMRAGRLQPYLSTFLSFAEIEMDGPRIVSSQLYSFCGEKSPREPILTEVQV